MLFKYCFNVAKYEFEGKCLFLHCCAQYQMIWHFIAKQKFCER